VNTQQLVAHLGRPLRLFDRRISSVERFLETPLDENDERHVRIACSESGGVRLGEFYHWYLQKLIISKSIRTLDRPRTLALIAALDRTDYTPARAVLESSSGVLVAVPHQSHYIFAIAGLSEYLRRSKRVYIFYGQPKTHRGNEVFDHFASMLWGNETGGNVEVIHDTRNGLAKAIKGLKSGGIVITMPDVFQKEDDTLVIPFCGRPLNVMLGTAALARKTGAWVLPVIPAAHGRGMNFQTRFGTRIDTPEEALDTPGADAIKAMDYAVTRRIFLQYEPLMRGAILYWQNMRKHLAQEPSSWELSRSELDTVAHMLQSDPMVAWGADATIDLRTPRR
jgi:Bacterial lipid A biosynthesis acyltransferase